jgi:hypothetical protein
MRHVKIVTRHAKIVTRHAKIVTLKSLSGSDLEVKSSLGAPHEQWNSFMRHAKIVTRHAQIVVRLGPENNESDTSLDL